MPRGSQLATRLYTSLFHRGSVASSCAPLSSRSFSALRSRHPESVKAWVDQLYPPLAAANTARKSPHPKPSGIPPFPGFAHAAMPAHIIADLQAANAQAGFSLSPPALLALQQAIIKGDIPVSEAHQLSERLREHIRLQTRFPGYDVQVQLIKDARVLSQSGSKVANSMRVFSDLAPRHLPTVGQLMQFIGSNIVTSARGTAAKLQLLDRECQTYFGMPFPVTALDPRNRSLLSITDREITEAAFALSVVWGKENACQAINADITLLSLPAAQIELPLEVLKRRLQIKLDDMSSIHLLQGLIVKIPSLLHMSGDSIRSRIDVLLRGALRSTQTRKKRGIHTINPNEIRLVLRAILKHPEALVSNKNLTETDEIFSLIESTREESKAEVSS